MADRRPLIEGLKPEPKVDPDVERSFVFQEKLKPQKPAALPKATAPLAAPAVNPAAQNQRVPLTVRVPAEMALALKRASFDRQLQGQEPSSQQDIIEEALKPWLRKHGYLP